MKIAIVSFFSGQNERGVENWTLEFSKHLRKGNKIYIYQNAKSKAQSTYTTISIPSKVNWETPNNQTSFLRRIFLDYWSLNIGVWTIKTLPSLWKNKFDVVIPTNGGWQVALVRIVTWLYGGKMIIVGHAGKGWDERNNLFSFPDLFVALTDNALKWSRKVNPFIKAVKIPDGVDTNKFNPLGPKINLKLPKPIYMVAGALESGKRIDLAIEAVSKLKKGSLLVVGKGDSFSKLSVLGYERLGNRFKLISSSYEDMPKYYRSADVFTLPSVKSEAFGMVYLEAMSSGLPIVATDDEVRREIIGNAGILIEPTDQDIYAKALEKAIKRKWGNAPSKQAKKFSWAEVSRRYTEIFNKI